MQIITVLEQLLQGEFEPGQVIKVITGEVIEVLSADRIRINFPTGEVDIWRDPTRRAPDPGPAATCA